MKDMTTEDTEITEQEMDEAEHSADGLHRTLTESIIGAAIDVHRSLGPGLLESAYEACLVKELMDRGLAVQRQVPVPLRYKGVLLEVGYRIDLLVEGVVIVEIKCADRMEPVFQAQLLTYMRLSNTRVGLLINFNTTQLIKGIKRLVL